MESFEFFFVSFFFISSFLLRNSSTMCMKYFLNFVPATKCLCVCVRECVAHTKNWHMNEKAKLCVRAVTLTGTFNEMVNSLRVANDQTKFYCGFMNVCVYEHWACCSILCIWFFLLMLLLLLKRMWMTCVHTPCEAMNEMMLTTKCELTVHECWANEFNGTCDSSRFTSTTCSFDRKLRNSVSKIFSIIFTDGIDIQSIDSRKIVWIF